MFGLMRDCCASLPQRWIFAIMCFLALFNAYAMRACLSIAITEMVVPKHEDVTYDEVCHYPEDDNNSEDPSSSNRTIGERFDWDEGIQGNILGSFYWGYVLTHIPGGMIAEKYGGKHTLGIGILSTAIFTLLTPSAVNWGGHRALILLRVLMGIGEGTTYPAINVLLAQWTPPEEKSRTGSFVYAGALIGTIYATTVSGQILHSSSANWPIVFYVIGATGVIWFVIWLITCYNNPRDHPFISIKEMNFLAERMAEQTKVQPAAVPWRHILTSKPLWASIIALIGFNWSILTLVTDLPKYMSGVLRFSVKDNGYLTSLGYLCMWLGGTGFSWLADHLITNKIMSTTRVRVLGSVIALSCSAVCILTASYAGCNRALVVGMFTVALTMLGAAFPSVMINALDLSPNYAGVLMALTNGISAFTGIFAPELIAKLAPNQTLTEWRLVFWILFMISVYSNIVFVIGGSGKIVYWNDPVALKQKMAKKNKEIEMASSDSTSS